MDAQSRLAVQQTMDGPILSQHRRKIVALLRHFAFVGLTLEECADAQHLSRSIKTLQRYACKESIEFPDYTPRHLKPKAEKKRGSRIRPAAADSAESQAAKET